MAICICKSYSIVVTSSMDCTMIIWDLNRLQYVQSIFDHKNPVKLLTISDTLGDIASVSNSDLGSYLKVHTINAKLVGTVYTPIPITAICYSNAKEGISVNVIVTGFLDGTIKLWNSWNLNLASVITTGNLQYPIISLTYSEDNQHLYAANKQGIVTMWKNPIKGIKESRFLTLK
ncbi:lysosomal-trafficking regulator-like [Centruroides sculpturatus]|uniref:lysosomal-trafficking regulator-like n=1 Tax=Centruroides sculpturatus TaxID=218467 RepID=UPI000C6DFF04|nr:lysosomal-trafficking regulator-like [Centruroides sculpturatus]